ncbi:GTPase HflX [Faecalicatena fissicatena]|uniref:GTPase HflX n=1 Tax=Faecalicatena fissicatena TaxID=290055 RepID=A0ABS2EBP5_9FIRM|nr:GTPase HflX [Faecalicatena fissicatena]MBM6739046.1 GTPase HflX [Faecalicatena fissicatena]
MYETAEKKERVILVGVSLTDSDDAEQSLDELEELARTAGALCVGRILQKREQMHPATYLGRGKTEELKELIWETQADGIICDDELSPAQIGNLKDELDVKIMDRTLLILDIFAARASTSEGKIQVELAQLRYRQSRLTGLGTSLSRLGGGIGTRGPGEKKLEMDRRLIKGRISQLTKELKEVKRHRQLTRESRARSRIPVIAIVGYTNAGKSTLLNYLTGAGILAEDKLFATLDPTTRNLKLPGGQEVLLTDTVGFIRKLPHHLIEAFKSTLEEAKYADLLLHVVDASNPQTDQQMHVVYETLRELEASDKPVITAFNKRDRFEGEYAPRDFQAERTAFISAKTGEGVDALLSCVEDVLREQKVEIEQIYPYSDAGKIQLIRKYGELEKEEYTQDGIYVRAYVPVDVYGKLTHDPSGGK